MDNTSSPRPFSKGISPGNARARYGEGLHPPLHGSDHIFRHLLCPVDGPSLWGESISNGRVIHWNFPAGTVIWTSQYRPPVRAAAWTRDGKLPARSLAGELTEVWDLDLAGGRPVGQGFACRLCSVVFTPDGKQVIAAMLIKDREVRNQRGGSSLVAWLGCRFDGPSPSGTNKRRRSRLGCGKRQRGSFPPLSDEAALAPPCWRRWRQTA